MTDRICYNCKWIKKVERASCEDFSTCCAPPNMILNLVTGELAPRFSYCSVLRRDYPTEAENQLVCGLKGRWFEPKEDKDG